MSTHVCQPEQLEHSLKRQRPVSCEEECLGESGTKRMKTSCGSEPNRYERIPQIPSFTLSLQQMNSDPVKLLSELEKKYKEFGAVRLTVNQRWNCPYTFRYVDKGITTRVQCLQNLKQGKAFEQNVQAYSIQSFEAFANKFESNYKPKTDPEGQSAQGKIELEYWTLVTDPTYASKEVRVQYAADLPSSRYGSGFPTRPMPNWKDSDFVYEKNLFNLNNIQGSPSSLLRMAEKRREKVSGITQPWVYMGMQFSTFCWHVQDLWVNSLNYNHKGGIKTWYIVPGSQKEQFDSYVKSKYCQKNSKKSLLNRITFMVDPLELIDAGISVYKTYQSPRDYVCTFFKAYHCGFSQSYNVGEAVNFLSPLSIKYMEEAQRAKQKEEKKTPNVFPIDWIIHENYRQIDTFTEEEQVSAIREAFKRMIEREKVEIRKAFQRVDVEGVEVFPEKTKYDKYQCAVCKEYLFLHAFREGQKKCYCLEHIPKETKVVVMVREPVKERAEEVSAWEAAIGSRPKRAGLGQIKS